MKKVLHLSSYDFGGAGMAAYRLHCNLRRAGFTSRMLVAQKREADDDVLQVGENAPASRLGTFLAKARLKFCSDRDYYFQDQTRSTLAQPGRILEEVGFTPDLIVVHWVSNFVSAADVRTLSLSCGAPVIWYLLDMAPLTGGCHYAWDCTGYFDACGSCRALRSINSYDRSHRIWREKAEALAGIEVAVASGSGWLDRQARNSSLFRGCEIRKVLLSVDPEVFRPLAKCEARQELGLPQDKKVLFFGNQGLGLKRKGMAELIEALRLLSLDPSFDAGSVLVAVAGSLPADFELPLPYKGLGFLKGDRMLALAYQAADVFMCPSIEDSGPMMINESIMCGTPVVAFEMGVAPDLVQPGCTGYRARLGDSADFARGIRELLALSPEEGAAMSGRCRGLGLELLHPERQVDAFLDLMLAVERGQRGGCGETT